MKRFAPLFLLAFAMSSFAVEVRYANEAATLLQGARLPGVAGVTLGLPPDPGGLGRSPAGLAEYTNPELVVHHAVLYSGLGATQDEFLLAVPLHGGVGLGVSLSRVGADGMMAVAEGEQPDFQNPRTFSATDWVGTLGIGKSWFDQRLLVGAAVKFLYRDLDQEGIGAQTEGSAVWKSPDGWRVGARFDRGFGSFASWMQTNRTEFSPADIVVGGGLEKRLPYFYGTGDIAWESPGLIQGEGSATFTDQDVRLTTDPWLFLRASRLGGEFRFDFGGVLRAGCEIQAITRLTDFIQDKDEEGLLGESRGMIAFGAGYLWNNRARVDYSLMIDPDLGSTHRVALGLVFGPTQHKVVAPEKAEPEVLPPARVDTVPVAKTTAGKPDSVVVPSIPAAGMTDSATTLVPPAAAPLETPAIGPAEAPVPAPKPPTTPVPKKVPANGDDEWDAPEKAQ